MNDNQKKLLAVGGGAAGLFVIWKRQQAKKQATGPITPTSAGGQIAPYTPVGVTTLDPGQTVYDPNTGNLLNTPTAGSSGQGPFSPGFLDPNAPGPQNGSPRAPNYVINVNYPKNVSKTRNRRKPATRTVSKLTAAQKKAGDVAAPFGRHKPKPRKGYVLVGTGGGNWVYKKVR